MVSVAGSGSLLDAAAAQLIGSPVELIADADEAERVAALALVSTRSLRQPRLSDVASDHNAERLRQLSDEVSRIASTLARLSSVPSSPRPTVLKAAIADAPPVSRSLCARLSGRGGFVPASSRKICSLTRPGICCLTFSRPRSRNCASRFPACASLLPFPPPQRCGG